MATAYPLTWPPMFQRTAHREDGRFKTTLDAAIRNVEGSLRLFGSDSRKPVRDVVISSNFSLGTRSPADPGVAVYFVWDELPVCIPVDRYKTLAANLQAVHHIIEGRRVEIRHGSLQLVRASFQGFKALPAPSGTTWRNVLKFPPAATPDRMAIEEQYRVLAKARHPDKPGGSHDAMAELSAARDQALQEVG